MIRAISFSIPIVLLLGCANEPNTEPRLTPASGATPEMSWNTRVEIAQFATKHCDYEQRCGNIGVGRQFVRRNQCEDYWLQQGFTLFGPTNCRDGVDHQSLTTCVESIDGLACGTPVDDVVRVEGCQAQDVCRAR